MAGPAKDNKPAKVTTAGEQGKPEKPGTNGKPGFDNKSQAVDDTLITDPRPLAATIDRWVDAGLAKAKLSSAAPVTDGEFVRRVTLDLIGRIPTEDEVVTFFADKDPDKRLNWINSLLLSPGFGGHYATVWRELMMPRDMTGVKRPVTTSLRGWPSNLIATVAGMGSSASCSPPKAGFASIRNQASF